MTPIASLSADRGGQEGVACATSGMWCSAYFEYKGGGLVRQVCLLEGAAREP